MRHSSLTKTERAQIIELIESLAWGDLARAIPETEALVTQAAVATEIALRNAQIEIHEPTLNDSYPLSQEAVERMTDLERDAYIARLVADLKLDRPDRSDTDCTSIGVLLRGPHGIILGGYPDRAR